MNFSIKIFVAVVALTFTSPVLAQNQENATFNTTFVAAAEVYGELVEAAEKHRDAKAALGEAEKQLQEADADAETRSKGAWTEDEQAKAYKAAFEARMGFRAAEEAFVAAQAELNSAAEAYKKTMEGHRALHEAAEAKAAEAEAAANEQATRAAQVEVVRDAAIARADAAEAWIADFCARNSQARSCQEDYPGKWR